MTTHYSQETALQLVQIYRDQVEALREENAALRAENDRLQGEIYLERIKACNEGISLMQSHMATIDFINSKLNMNG